MALIEWSESLSVGITEFDDQHKKLIELINQLNDAMKAGKAKEILAKIFSDIVTYTATHFAAEEKLLGKHEYVHLFAHKTEHNKLVTKALELNKDFQSGKMMISMAVMDFLKEWLQTHILGTDKKYGPFLNGKGVK